MRRQPIAIHDRRYTNEELAKRSWISSVLHPLWCRNNHTILIKYSQITCTKLKENYNHILHIETQSISRLSTKLICNPFFA